MSQLNISLSLSVQARANVLEMRISIKIRFFRQERVNVSSHLMRDVHGELDHPEHESEKRLRSSHLSDERLSLDAQRRKYEGVTFSSCIIRDRCHKFLHLQKSFWEERRGVTLDGLRVDDGLKALTHFCTLPYF